MLDQVRKYGTVDLAMHLLRTSLRDAALSRNAWLSALAHHDPQSENASTAWASRRTLLVSGKWFESIHHHARNSSGSSWVINALRHMMESEAQAIQEEYQILTAMEMEDRAPIPPTSLINRISPELATSKPGERTFSPKRHLEQLRQTHGQVIKLLSVSVHQVEKRRQSTTAKNARRAEKAAEAAREEAARIEAKQAGRRRREEVVESTLVLA